MVESRIVGRQPTTSPAVDDRWDADDDQLTELSECEQERLVTILDQYMIDEEEGRRVDITQLLMQNEDLRKPLQHYLTGLQLVRELAPSLAPSSLSAVRSATENSEPLFRAQPSRLGPYELGASIGRGAMGIVYRAYDRQRGREVAVKVLAYGTIVDSSRIDRFRREAQTAAQLDHPNLVPVYAVGCDRGINYYAMQLIEGESLDYWLQWTRSRPTISDTVEIDREELQHANPLVGGNRFRRIAQLIATAARALHGAHLAGVVHRDVKPSNLLLGRDGRIWITDFGLARVQAEHALTHTGELVGTVRYMSPEQAKGQNERIDARTDVYGLGATLYELTTLTPAFPGDDMMELLRRIQSEEPPLPGSHCTELPRDLETIILRALRPQGSDRYPTAAAFADDLQRFVAGQPIQAQSVTLPERFTAWARRHRSLALGLIVAWFGLLLSSIATTVLVMRAQSRTVAALNKSESHYRQARSILATLGASSAKRLAEIPAAESVRKDILAQTIGYYEKFIASSAEDPLLQLDVARTHFEIARLTALSGDYDSAERAYRASLESLFPANDWSGLGTEIDGSLPRWTIESQANVLFYVHVLNDWALLNSAQGDQQQAQKRLRMALATVDPALGDSTEKCLELVLAKALSLNNIGVVELRQGKPAESSEHLQQAIALLETVPMDVVRQSPLGVDMADAFSNLSVLLGNAELLSEAAQAAGQSLALRLAMDPSRAVENQSRSAVTYNNLAAFLWQSQKSDEAIVAYQRAVELLEQVIRHAPGQVEAQQRLAITLNNLGMALAGQHAASQAIRVFERAEELTKPSVAVAPGDVQAARRLATILNNHAAVLLSEQLFPEAKQRLHRAAELLHCCENRSQQHDNSDSLVKHVQDNLDRLNSSFPVKLTAR